MIAFVWIHREQIARWWSNLFAPPHKAVEEGRGGPAETDAPPPPALPFSAFRNPIGPESDPRQVIVVTFQALEAWSREQGWERSKGETPSEFVSRIANSLPRRPAAAARLVDAYNRVVYGNGRANKTDVNAASQVWSMMR